MYSACKKRQKIDKICNNNLFLHFYQNLLTNFAPFFCVFYILVNIVKL